MRTSTPSATRLSQTTDTLYMSGPYFMPDEAMSVKATIIQEAGAGTTTTATTIERMLSARLEILFGKRRATGDWQTCGPHDLAPVYLQCFGVEKAEIEDEKFVSRLRRSGSANGYG